MTQVDVWRHSTHRPWNRTIVYRKNEHSHSDRKTARWGLCVSLSEKVVGTAAHELFGGTKYSRHSSFPHLLQLILAEVDEVKRRAQLAKTHSVISRRH